MLNSSGLNPPGVLLGTALSTCRNSVGAPIRGLRGPLFAFNLERLPRLDAREAKLLVLSTHSCPLVEGLS